MDKTTKQILNITIDTENSAETFWGLFWDKFPELSQQLDQNGTACVTSEVWQAIQAIDGFSGGPSYAPTALVVVNPS